MRIAEIACHEGHSEYLPVNGDQIGCELRLFVRDDHLQRADHKVCDHIGRFALCTEVFAFILKYL